MVRGALDDFARDGEAGGGALFSATVCPMGIALARRLGDSVPAARADHGIDAGAAAPDGRPRHGEVVDEGSILEAEAPLS